jgi:hydroxypyruvate isomerase
MFDCYHIFHESGELEANFAAYAKQIGHVQIAAAEDRTEPFFGVIDYQNLLPQFQKMGYSGAFGCEYRPRGKTDAGLSWRSVF